MDTHHSESDAEPLGEQALTLSFWRLPDQSDTGADGLGSVRWPLQLWPSNAHSNLRASAFLEDTSAETSQPFSDMGTWGPSTSTASHCYYPLTLPQDLQVPAEEPLDQNWTRVPQSHQRGLAPEWAEEIPAPGYGFPSYNTESLYELPTESSMKITGNDYIHPQCITQSHGNEHQQLFPPTLEDSVRATYVIPDMDGIGPHSSHMGAHSDAMSSQSFRQLEEHSLQPVVKPLPPRLDRRLEATSPVVYGSERLLHCSVPLNMARLSREERSGRSMAPLVTYNTSLGGPQNSPICPVNSPYILQVESVGYSTDDYLQSSNSESSPQVSRRNAEFPSPDISATHLQCAVSTGDLHFSPVQAFRAWTPSPHIRTEPSSPTEDTLTTMHRNKHRRSSLKTCGLEEAGLDFPGCYVLVPTAEESETSETTIIEGPGPGLISTKKNFRKPMIESERQLIKLNRKYGVCLRCKMFKEKCRGGFPCDRCRSLKLWKNICVTAHFADKSIFSRGLYKARVSLLLGNVREWLSPESHHKEIIEISNGYLPKLTITLQRFDPIDASVFEHILWRELRKANFTRIPSSYYGIIGGISSQFELYFDNHIYHLVNEIQNAGTTVYSQIYAKTLFFAQQYTIDNKETGTLVRKTLRIWAAQIVFFKCPWRICGTNTAGMRAITEPVSSICGITPLPRLANQQLDAEVESWIADLEQEVLLELQQKIFRRNPADWFGIYLALFVTLSSLERDTWGLRAWATDNDKLSERVKPLVSSRPVDVQKVWTWPLQEMPEVLVERNSHLVEILAAHFRSVTKGYIPFTLDWSSEPATSMIGKEVVAVEYMRSVGKQVKESDQFLHAVASMPYNKETFDSLNFIYCSKLMVSEDT